MTVEQEFLSLRRQVIRREFARMNDPQFQAVSAVEGPILILAGAGSGKTTVLIQRICQMIRFGRAYEENSAPFATQEDVDALRACLEKGTPAPSWIAVDPIPGRDIMAITFTNKAAKELKERLDLQVGEEGRDVWAATFHSTCARILRRYADRLGYSSRFTIYDTDDQKKLMKEVMKRLELDEKMLPIKSILNEISRAKDELIGPEEYAKRVGIDDRLAKIARAYAAYQAALKEYDAVDFDDLLFLTVRLFEQEPQVLAWYQDRFRYLMIDEYQDTNHAQYRFAKLLAGDRQNLCVVGDDDQSIYRFRGATIENILSFEKEYPGAKVIRLEQNYRSTQVILDAANAVIANNSGRKGKRLWTDRTDGKPIVSYRASDESDEARFIADQIQENLAAGLKPSDHAILYRMNAQSNALENVLMRSGIPYRVVGALKFFDRKEIRDVVAYLNLIHNASDGIALARVINEPKRGIGDTTLTHLGRLAAENGCSMLEISRHADEYADLSRAYGKLKDFASLIDRLTERSDEMPIHEFFQLLVTETGYLASLEAQGDEGKDRLDNVNEFASSILSYEKENDSPTLSGFLEEIALITDMDREEEERDRVWLMTMHTAKGLEFPVVFLVGAEEGIFPGTQSIYGEKDDMEEERRLAYVGITRAKNRLYITHASSRMLFGRTERNMPSRFLSEIPDELIEKQESAFSYHAFSGFGKASGRSYGGTRDSFGFYEEPQKPRTAPSYAAKAKAAAPVKTAGFRVGQRVRHKAFGEGTVISAVAMGNDMMLQIAFDTVGTKKLMSNFAHLESV